MGNLNKYLNKQVVAEKIVRTKEEIEEKIIALNTELTVSLGKLDCIKGNNLPHDQDLVLETMSLLGEMSMFTWLTKQ